MIARVAMIGHGGLRNEMASTHHISGLRFTNSQATNGSYDIDGVEPTRGLTFAGVLDSSDKEE